MKNYIWGDDNLKIIEAGEDLKQSVLATVENRIYFYSKIEMENILKLRKNIQETGTELIRKFSILNIEEEPKIYLHIFSYGGSIHAGLAGMDAILTAPVPVVTIIDGACASAATLLSIVGNKRYINKHATVLIHQLSTFFWGKYSEFEDEKRNLDLYMKILSDIYLKYTKIPEEKLKEILTHDIWFDSEMAVEYSIVDEVIKSNREN